jgi:hypothetical protein
MPNLLTALETKLGLEEFVQSIAILAGIRSIDCNKVVGMDVMFSKYKTLLWSVSTCLIQFVRMV